MGHREKSKNEADGQKQQKTPQNVIPFRPEHHKEVEVLMISRHGPTEVWKIEFTLLFLISVTFGRPKWPALFLF